MDKFEISSDTLSILLKIGHFEVINELTPELAGYSYLVKKGKRDIIDKNLSGVSKIIFTIQYNKSNSGWDVLSAKVINTFGEETIP